MRYFRYITIDPRAQEIRLHEAQNGASYDLLKMELNDAVLQRVRLGENNDLWVDDEGLFRPGQRFFTLKKSGVLIAGRVVLAGSMGPVTISLNNSVTVENVARRVKWIGDKHDAEAAIKSEKIERPSYKPQSLDGSDPMTTWEWTPDETPDDVEI